MFNEEDLQRAMFSQPTEKTFIDKILARKDVDELREIVKKDPLTRSDYLEILYLLSGVESKLMNYGAWDRYVILKYFVWIREFCKQAEFLFDYTERLEEKEKMCKVCHKTKEGHKEAHEFEQTVVLTDRTKKLLKDAKKSMEHIVKFHIDLYLNIARTSLSTGATAFMEILTQKYEVSYPQANSSDGVVNDKSNNRLWRR